VVAAVTAGVGLPVLAIFFGLVTLFLLQFFRDPERKPEGGEETIVSPADGTILSIAPAPEAPPGASRRVTIFMSVFNCHVNRSPVTGKLTDYIYTAGQKMAAFEEKASLENEQNRVTISAGRGAVTFKQIAGLLARRIVFRPHPGDSLSRGERVGMIRFGSRVDLFVPDDAEIRVARGGKVKAGQTAIARWT